MAGEEVFRTLREVKDTFFPNIPMDELLGESTEEQIQEDLRRFVEMARQNSGKVVEKNSKKLQK